MSQRLAPLHYFAYGSNMNPERVSSRKLSTQGEPEAGRLLNYELRFNKISRYRIGAASANIAPAFGCSVDGVLYRLTGSRVIASMDVFENSPEDYAREVVFVHVDDAANDHEARLIPAWTYVAKPHAIDDALRPTQEYVGHLLASPFMTETVRTRLLALDYHDA